MDGGKKAAARPAPAAEATQQPAALPLETPALSDDDAAAAQQVDDGQPDVASVDESHGATVGCGGNVEEDHHHDDDDDEQVERFYALLANIRAMRGLALPLNMASSSTSYGSGGRGENDDTHTDTETQPAGAGDSTRTKRLRPRRSAEPPPWRPVFTMEDFEEPAPPPPSSCNIRKRTRDAAAGPQRR